MARALREGVAISLLLLPMRIEALDERYDDSVIEGYRISCNHTAEAIKLMLDVLRSLDAEIPGGAKATRAMVVSQLKMDKLVLDAFDSGIPCQSAFIDAVLKDYRALEPSFGDSDEVSPYRKEEQPEPPGAE